MTEGMRERGVESMEGRQKETCNSQQGGPALGRKPTRATDGQRATNNQGVGRRKLEGRSIRSGLSQWERSDPKSEDKLTRQTELSQQGSKLDGEGEWN